MKLTFIVLTTFYPAGQQAVQYADSLASTLGARLVLLHANRVSVFAPYVFAGEEWRRQELADETDVQRLLDQMAAQLHAPATVNRITDLLPEVVQDLTARHRLALFVLGMPAARHASSDQLSTAALELLRAAQCPVLLVPTDTAPPVFPRHAVVAADREGFGLPKPATAARTLLRSLNADLTVAHVSSAEDNLGCAQALHAVQTSGLVAPTTSIALHGHLRANPAMGLLEVIQNIDADLLVVLARERSYLGELFHRSVTAQLVERSPIPMLIIPVTESKATPHQQSRQRTDGTLLWPEI